MRLKDRIMDWWISRQVLGSDETRSTDSIMHDEVVNGARLKHLKVGENVPSSQDIISDVRIEEIRKEVEQTLNREVNKSIRESTIVTYDLKDSYSNDTTSLELKADLEVTLNEFQSKIKRKHLWQKFSDTLLNFEVKNSPPNSNKILDQATIHPDQIIGGKKYDINLLEKAVLEGKADAEIYRLLGHYHIDFEQKKDSPLRNFPTARNEKDGIYSPGFTMVGNTIKIPNKTIKLWIEALNKGQVNAQLLYDMVSILPDETTNKSLPEEVYENTIDKGIADETIFSALAWHYFERRKKKKLRRLFSRIPEIESISKKKLLRNLSLEYDLNINLRDRDKRKNNSIWNFKMLTPFNREGLLTKMELTLTDLIDSNLWSIKRIEVRKQIYEAVDNNQINASTLMMAYSLHKSEVCVEGLLYLANKESTTDYRAFQFLAEISKDENRAIKGKREENFLKMLIDQAIANDEFKPMLDVHRKATKTTMIIGRDYLLSHTLIIKKGKTTFDSEKRSLDELEAIVGDEVKLPKYIAHFEHNGDHYYAMVKAEGQTLTELLAKQQPKPETYSQILSTMAKIHVLYPIEKEDNELMRDKFDKRINDMELSEEFRESCEPMLEVLLNSRNWCYNNDSTTDNWILLEDEEVMLIDTEYKGSCPYAYEIAQFLNFVPHMDFKDRISTVKNYVKLVNAWCEKDGKEDKKIKDEDQFLLEYCNGVVYRAITSSPYFAGIGRYEDEENVRNTGIEMIDHMLEKGMIKENQQEQYKQIKKTLEEYIPKKEEKKEENVYYI